MGTHNYRSHGTSEACIDRNQNVCPGDGEVCAGEAGSNFVYEITGNVLSLIPPELFSEYNIPD